MNLSITHLWRSAPRIFLLCYIIQSSYNIVLSTNLVPFKNLSFVGCGYFNKIPISSIIRPYNEFVGTCKHTQGYSVVNSSFKNNFFGNLPYPKGDKSFISKFWYNLKSYFNKKFPSVKSQRQFNRNKPVSVPEGYLKQPQINPLSFFDFFDNPRNTGNEYKIKSDFDKRMSQESPYMELVSSGPSSIIKTFLKVAPAMVKDAISLTVSTLIGSFYKYSAETTIITTTDRLASLILNLQVTGYIYCNAEQRYRLSSLYGHDDSQSSNQNDPDDSESTLSVGEQMGTMPIGDELLSYVKRLPRSYVNGIFDNMNPEIIDAMRLSTEKTIQLLTESLVSPNYLDMKDRNKIIIQQTGSFAMQLCFWKLALGYCMRDQETKIELSRSLNSH